MVCYAMSEPGRCQCIVRDSSGNKVYEVTLSASTPASTLLVQVANKLDKFPHELSLIYQNLSHVVEIRQGTTSSLQDFGFKTSHNRNNLVVQELFTNSNNSTSNRSTELNNPTNDEEEDESGETISEEGETQMMTTPSIPTLDSKPNYKLSFIPTCSSPSKFYQRSKTCKTDNKADETGVPSTSLPPPSRSFVGLVNQAMTCYLNSLLQALFMTPEFRNALYKWKFDGDKPSKSIPFQLQKLFLNLQTSSRCAVETTELTLSFGWGTGDVWHQHDVQELCRVMFDALEQEFKNTCQSDLINHLYQGKMIDYVKCLECGREKSREDTFLDIPLPVRPYGSTVAYSSIEEAMRAFVTPEILDGNNQYFCDNCNRKCNAHKGLKFSSFPYLLTLHLKRFDFDYSTMHRIKLNDKVVFPEILELDYFLKYPTASGEMEPATIISNCKYDEGSTNCSTTDSALGDDMVITGITTAPTHSHLLNSPTDHESNEDEGIVWDKSGTSVGAASVSSSSSSGSYSGSESCEPPAPPAVVDSQEKHVQQDTADADLESPDQTVPQMENVADETLSDSNAINNVISGSSESQLRYELYSIMIHSGSASGGHYYAYIKDFITNQWFCFNDQSVSRVTVEDIEKSYGGGPSRGYYSGVFSSSTNAYMLMYRLIDGNRNAFPMTPDEFPQHIKDLVEEMRAREEQERRSRARDEEMVKIKVCYQSNQIKVFVHRDDPFSEALKQAYDNLQLHTQVRREDCRLVSYCISKDWRDCSLEDKEQDSMASVLAYLKSNNCSIDFVLETKHPNLTFPIYRPDDLRIDICRVNVPREEVLSIQLVQVPVGIVVSGLKRHLRLVLPELLPPPPYDLALVVNHRSSTRFPQFTHLSDDQLCITQVLDQTSYNKIFVAPLTPALVADLENGFEKSNFLRFLRRVENVVILHVALPQVNEDVLERLMIPLLTEQKNVDNNNKMIDINSVENQCSSIIRSSEDDNMSGCSGNTGAATASDQSTSEDSSLTDSERTVIGDAPQLEGQLSSPSDSEQLSSPETNLGMEMNGEIDMDGYEDKEEKHLTNRDSYIKLSPYTQNSQRMVKIVVDRGAEWSLVEKWLESCCGVPKQYLLVTTGCGDEARSSDSIATLFSRKHYDYLTVKLHRPLGHNEYKKKVYTFLKNSAQPFQYLCDWIIVRGQTVGESKKALLKYLEKRNLLQIPYNRCRLRRKNWKAVGRPWLDSDTWEELGRHPHEILIEQLEDSQDEKVTSHNLVPIFIRRVYPSKLSFSSFQEIVIDTTQPLKLIKQISEISDIPIEHLNVAKSCYNFPWDMSVYSALQDLEWVQDTVILSNPCFSLDSDDNTPIILFRDAREEKKKKLQVNTIDCSSEYASLLSDKYTRRSTERLSIQSPRKEKPLKIYLQSKESTPPPGCVPPSDSIQSVPLSDNSSNCYVPPPDYD